MTLTELADQWEWDEMAIKYDLSKEGAIELLAADMLQRSRDGKTTVVQFVEHGEVLEPEKPKRTNKQNAALHQYCRMLAKALNDAGFDMKRTLKADAEISWTDHAVKENLWRPVQVAMFGVESTTQPETGQYTQIYEVINRKIAQTTGVSVPWPSLEAQSRSSISGY